MKQIFRAALGAVLAALAALPTTQATAQATAPPQDRINWGWFNAAPYMIESGPNRQQGVFDQLRALMRERLPEYAHQDIQAPFPRIFQEIRNGNPWCFLGGVKTPQREALAYFSAPVAVFLPFKVIVRKDRRAEFGARVSLDALLDNPAMRTSFLRGRTHTPGIDAVLRAHPEVAYHSEFNEALQMLLARRLDYLVEQPIISAYSAQQLGRSGELVALDIAESDELTLSRVMCPRTEWGRQVVERVNRVLGAERNTVRYRAIVERWSDPEGVRAIRAIYPSRMLQAE